jgi:hypothetical protein
VRCSQHLKSSGLPLNSMECGLGEVRAAERCGAVGSMYPDGGQIGTSSVLCKLYTIVDLKHDVDHPSCLCARQKHLSTGGKGWARDSAVMLRGHTGPTRCFKPLAFPWENAQEALWRFLSFVG